MSRESHEALVAGSNRWQSSFDFTVEEVRGTSVAVETGHGLQTSFDERQEKIMTKSRGCIRREHERAAM